MSSTDNLELARAVVAAFFRREYNPVMVAGTDATTCRLIIEEAAQARRQDDMLTLDLSRARDANAFRTLTERIKERPPAERPGVIHLRNAVGAVRGSNRGIRVLRFRADVGLIVSTDIPVVISWATAAQRRWRSDMEIILEPFEWGLGVSQSSLLPKPTRRSLFSHRIWTPQSS